MTTECGTARKFDAQATSTALVAYGIPKKSVDLGTRVLSELHGQGEDPSLRSTMNAMKSQIRSACEDARKDPQLEAVLSSRVAGFVSRAEARLYEATAECQTRAVGYMLQQYDHVPRATETPKAPQAPAAPPAPQPPPAPKGTKRKKASGGEKAAAVALDA